MTDAFDSGSIHISAADLGSNTVKITHAVVEGPGSLVELREATNTLRLGAGIESARRVEPERVDACLAFLKSEENVGRALGSTAFVGVATEALREASNGEELLARVHTETGWKIRIITGDDEARLTYIGLRDRVPAEGDSVIVDIGGGSTEIVLIQHGQVVWQKSIALGSGRLADRFFRDDPPGLDPIMGAAAATRQQLEAFGEIPRAVRTALFSGGNGVFVKELVHQLFPGNPLSIHTVERLLQHLAVTPAHDTADRLGIVRERARVLPAGASIAFAFLLHSDAEEVMGVPSGIRLGLIREYAGF